MDKKRLFEILDKYKVELQQDNLDVIMREVPEYVELFNYLQENAYQVCTKISSVPSNLFSNNDKIKTVVIGDKCTNIGNNAFANCENLTNVSMSNNVESIGTSAFRGCTKLSDVTLSEKLESLPSNCFSDCTSLNDIYLPDNLHDIGYRCFNGCDNIKIRYHKRGGNLKKFSIDEGEADFWVAHREIITDTNECLQEDIDDLISESELTDIENALQEYIGNKPYQVYSTFEQGGPTLCIKIDGDWKHDHLYVDKVLVPNFFEDYKDGSYEVVESYEDSEPSDSDNYIATHNYIINRVAKIVEVESVQE